VRKRLSACLLLGLAIASAAAAAHSSSAATKQGDLASVVKRNLIQIRIVMDDSRACAGCSKKPLRAETVALRAMKAISLASAQASVEVARARVAAFEGFRSYGESAYAYGQSRYYSEFGQIKASQAEIRIAHRQLAKARLYARAATTLLHIRI